MILKQILAGDDRNFSYIIADEISHAAAAIDPGFPPASETDFLKQNELLLRYIINTHGHTDHTAGNEMLAKLTGARIAMHASTRSKHDIDLNDGDHMELGSLELTIIHTPGHTHDSLCILADGNLITGDTLFVGKIGGTGFGRDAWDEYQSIHRKLAPLPPETKVWPGHDYGVRSSSTIGEELRENPFILRDSFESFVDLKKNWAEYKRIHGIQ